jgi:hypothetical protein
MSFFCRLSRRHYWCTPHRSADRRLVQVCYECGAERPASEIKDDFAIERFNHSRAAAKAQAQNLSSPRAVEEGAAGQERIAVGQGRFGRFLLVK